MKKLVLASASPRRRELLQREGFKLDVISCDIDENIHAPSPELLVMELALLKASAACKKIKPDALVIGADTVVCIDKTILGKPCDSMEAKKMLTKLSGRAHQVYTGVCVIDNKTAYAVCRYKRTDVIFRRLTKKQIRDYIKTGEPFDKAGGYGIQGEGGKLVRCIVGDYSNVVGLPVELLMDILNNEFKYFNQKSCDKGDK
jgi:septum formation protein